MRKKLMLGSILVLTLLLLMPSIPAIQINTVNNAIQDGIEKQLNITEIKEIITGEQLPKHPILFLIVWIIASFRLSRAWFLYNFSTEWPDDWHWPTPDVKYPLLYLRFWMLVATIQIWIGFWQNVSHILNWDWYF